MRKKFNSEEERRLAKNERQREYRKNNKKERVKKTPEELKESLEKSKRTCLEKYGVEYTFQVPKFKEKAKQTNLEKYGVEHYTNHKKAKQTNLEKYGVEYASQIPGSEEKQKQTRLEKYGDKNYNNSEKREQSNLEKYGVKNPFQVKEFQEKSKQTCLEKYGDKKYNNRGKAKETCLEIYGVENPNQCLETRKKINQTKLEKYRDENYRNVEKILETSYLKLYENDKFKNLIIPLFSFKEYLGVNKNYKFQCVKCGNVFKDTLNSGKIPRCSKCFPKSNFTKPHKTVCEYLEEQNIKFEIEKTIKPYHTDIFIEPNKIIEVNGDYWHANSKFYKEAEFINYFGEKILAKDIWKKDENRINYLKSKNFQVLILWEYDIKNNIETIKTEIFNFLKMNIDENHK